VEAKNEIRTTVVNRLKVCEKEKEALEGPKDEAVEFINKENNVRLSAFVHSSRSHFS